MKQSFTLTMAAGILSVTAAVHHPAQASDSFTEAGDWLQILLPTSAMATSLIKGDDEGAKALLKSSATTAMMTHGFKFAVAKSRPDFSAENSFPSGHTSAAFSGAAYFYSRYGATWGLPAYALAAYTGWSRVHADKHYWDDVIAGAGIAVLSNLYFVDQASSEVMVSPWSQRGASGINVTISNDFFKPSKAASLKSAKPSLMDKQFDLFLGGANFGHLPERLSHSASQTRQSTTTAAMRWQWQPSTDQHWSFYTQPVELRGEFNNPHQHQQHWRYQIWDNALDWQYPVLNHQDWQLRMGAGLHVQHAKLASYRDNDSNAEIAAQSEWLVFPTINGVFEANMAPKVDMQLGQGLGHNGRGHLAIADAALNYRFNSRWNAALGCRFYCRQQDNAKTLKRVAFNDLFLRIGYRF